MPSEISASSHRVRSCLAGGSTPLPVRYVPRVARRLTTLVLTALLLLDPLEATRITEAQPEESLELIRLDKRASVDQPAQLPVGRKIRKLALARGLRETTGVKSQV
jgi:hypothetical protein